MTPLRSVFSLFPWGPTLSMETLLKGFGQDYTGNIVLILLATLKAVAAWLLTAPLFAVCLYLLFLFRGGRNAVIESPAKGTWPGEGVRRFPRASSLLPWPMDLVENPTVGKVLILRLPPVAEELFDGKESDFREVLRILLRHFLVTGTVVVLSGYLLPLG
jgi:hypothetical protein